MRLPLLLLVIICSFKYSYGQSLNDTAARVHTDLPYLSEARTLAADLYFNKIAGDHLALQYTCYRYNRDGDSLLVLRKQLSGFSLSGRLSQKTILFTGSDGPAYYLPVFYNILQKTGTVPPGSYKVFVRLKSDSAAVSRMFVHEVDSALSPTSPLRSALNGTLLPEHKAKLLGVDLSAAAKTVNGIGRNTARTVDRAAGKIDRLFRSKGLTTHIDRQGGKDYINLYYEDWFVGRYELDMSQSLDKQIRQQRSRLTAPVASLASNELENYRSLLSQVKDLTRQQQEDRELQGEIALSGNWSSEQPEYSAQDNNYYELRGRVETEIMELPVGIEGFYTTQDQHRSIKASYIRVHYDAEKAKSRLLRLIGGFRNQFSQTLAKGQGLEQVYGSYLSGIGAQKDQLLRQLKKETGVSDINTGSLDTAGLLAGITAGLRRQLTDTAAALLRTAGSNGPDSAGKLRQTAAGARRVADSADRIYKKNLQRYRQLVELEQKARKYYTLLEQYRNTSYFDSALGYERVRDLEHADAATYKQLASKAAALLPEGKVKRFATGLTNLDLGIFPKDVSRYTMAGQQLKGLDAGYDLGFCVVGATYGSTQFAGRDGTLDKYATYSGRAEFKPARDQKIGLVYYGYNPARSMLSQDTFFRNVDMALPSFRQPVHVLSAAYTGALKKTVNVEGEIATSFQSGEGGGISDKLSADRIAWHLNAEGVIPVARINLQAGYEHGGRDFRNSTLPLNIAGTDRLRIAAKGDFFRSFLTLGVEFNNIRQQSFASEGNNNRWGFEIATHSKRYPSVALSYKPYTTFRSYTDTLAIPQRPLTGAVWTGRGSYQIKQRGGRSWRFTAIYNKSTSNIDTSSFGSDMLQLNVIYTTQRWMALVTAGNTDQHTNVTAGDVPGHMRTTFLSLSGSYLCGARTSLTAGLDLGIASFGLSKYGGNAGVQYRMKVPLSVRAALRYSEYRLTETAGWKNYLYGSLDLIWQFRMKLKNPH